MIRLNGLRLLPSLCCVALVSSFYISTIDAAPRSDAATPLVVPPCSSTKLQARPRLQLPIWQRHLNCRRHLHLCELCYGLHWGCIGPCLRCGRWQLELHARLHK